MPNLVGVPTHFFKVVLAESKSRNLLGAKPVRCLVLKTVLLVIRPSSMLDPGQDAITQKHAQCADASCDTIIQTVVGAFVMPNAPIDPDMPLTSFTVPLEALESASGLRFFPVRSQHIHTLQSAHPHTQHMHPIAADQPA